MDAVNDLVTFFLSSQLVEPILRGDVTCILWPVDLYAILARSHTRFWVLAIECSIVVMCTLHWSFCVVTSYFLLKTWY